MDQKEKPTSPKEVRVTLSGEDGNVYAIIGRTTRALKRAGFPAEAEVYAVQARACPSYDAVLQLTMATVDVE